MGMHNILDGFFASETVIVFIRQDISCISGFIPVRYAYLLLLCKTMLNKCTFLPKNFEHIRHSYYLCTHIQITSNYTTMTTTIKDLKVGDYFKLSATGRVYVRDAYNRSTKKYEYYDYDDVNRFHECKGTKPVITDFVF